MANRHSSQPHENAEVVVHNYDLVEPSGFRCLTKY